MRAGVTEDQILEMNFESMSIPEMDARGFYEYVKSHICPDKRTHLFRVDEATESVWMGVLFWGRSKSGSWMLMAKFRHKGTFEAYTRFGGMPMLADIGLETDRVMAALDGVYSAAVVNDILERENGKDSER